MIQSLPSWKKQGKTTLESWVQAKETSKIKEYVIRGYSTQPCIHFVILNKSCSASLLRQSGYTCNLSVYVRFINSFLESFHFCMLYYWLPWKTQNLFCYNMISILFIHLTLPWNFDFLNNFFYDKLCSFW